MPFITEELWQRMGGAEERPVSIALAPYPQYHQSATDLGAEREVQILQEIIGAARDLRADMKLDPKIPIAGKIHARGLSYKVVAQCREAIRQIARVDLEVLQDGAGSPWVIPKRRAQSGRRTSSTLRSRSSARADRSASPAPGEGAGSNSSR